MCGISGCQLNRPLTDEDIVRLRRLRDALTHRGPDGAGEFIDADEGIYFGHRRLSIIDLDPRSAQPMQRGDTVIVYNGEIYNYLELIAELKQTYSFKTKGDTEVILRSWQEWGKACLNKFDGMFAFAMRHLGETVLVTDAFGEKPLYYLERPEGVYFSSEAGPLIREFNLTFAPSAAEISDFLYLGYIRPPYTGYPGLSAMPPASMATLNRDGRILVATWWRPPEPHTGNGSVKSFSSAEIDTLRDLLCQSLKTRLRSDVPLGLFLSGGVDSSLIAALASREMGLPMEAFTVAFPDGQDESGQAQSIARHLSLSHHIIDSKGTKLWKDAPAHLADLYGVPNDNMTAFAVYQMCESAKPHLTVALSGLGGDELFYGYNKYQTLYRNRTVYRHATFFHALGCMLGPVVAKAATMSDLLDGSDSRRYLRLKNGSVISNLEKSGINRPKSLIAGRGDLVHRVRQYDLLISMPQSYIPAVDRGSMRSAIEVRTPFLNRTLMDYVGGLDQRRLIGFGMKGMTRKLLERYMPLDLLAPGKQGFVYPSERYLLQKSLSVPTLAGVPQTLVEQMWQIRDQKHVQTLCLRLAILSHFQERKSA